MSMSPPYPDIDAPGLNAAAPRTLIGRLIAWLPIPWAAVPPGLAIALALPLVLAYYRHSRRAPCRRTACGDSRWRPR